MKVYADVDELYPYFMVTTALSWGDEIEFTEHEWNDMTQVNIAWRKYQNLIQERMGWNR